MKRSGTIRPNKRRKTQPEQFWAQVEKTDGCWLWTGGRFPTGYGRVNFAAQLWYTHRLAYTLTHGPIPAGMFVCHHCDNPPCARPDHLFLGTAADNVRDRDAKGRSRGGALGHRGPYPNTPHGEQCPQARLTAVQVTSIRQRYAAGGLTHKALAHEFGVGETTIYSLLKGKSWRYVSEDGGSVTAAASTADL